MMGDVNHTIGTTITLDSEEGQQLLGEAEIRQDVLVDMFDFQEHRSHCGVQSCALLLAAFERGTRCRAAGRCRGFKPCEDIKERYHGWAMFSFQETRAVITHEIIPTRGVSLPDVSQILRNHGHETTVYFAEESSVDVFRRLALEALRHDDSSAGIIVNYQRFILGQTPQRTKYGHHSPLGAYHEDTDRFLVLDTNIIRPRLWLKTEDLFEAMQDVDNATGRSRGFLIMGGYC